MRQTVLVTGTSRGMGLELVKVYAAHGWDVIAVCRDEDSVDRLRRIHPNVTPLIVDLAIDSQIANLKDKLNGRAIDVLICNAVYAKKEHNFLELNNEDWVRSMQVNALSILSLTRTLLDNIMLSHSRKIACISSDMSDFSVMSGNKNYCYQASKGAGQMVIKKLAKDLYSREISVVAIHPGWMKTNLGGADAPKNPEDSAASIFDFINSISLSHSHRFFNYDGHEIAW
jgi:NAD(P)-dependent dehydrogenase (short-subunit alcohol dehydrogenase family)